MTIPYPSDMPEVLTNAELVDMLTAVDALTPTNGEDAADRHAQYAEVMARANKYRRVRTRDAGQPHDVAVVVARGAVAYYRPLRSQKDGEPDVMPLPAEAVRRTFSEGMQRALWGCVA